MSSAAAATGAQASSAGSAAHTQEITGFSRFWRTFAAGGFCASFNHVILVPLDVIKTRMQISPASYPSPNVAAKKVYAEGGVRGLLAGLGPTAVGYAVQGGLKFSLYDAFVRTAKRMQGDNITWDGPALYLPCAAAAEVVATSMLSPWEALRIKMVADPAFARRGTLRGLAEVHGREGMAGFYRGLLPLLFKQVPYTMVQLAVFSTATTFAYEKVLPTWFNKQREDLSSAAQLTVSLGCGVLAGVTSSLASQPGDTVLTRINAKLKANAVAGSSGAAPSKPPTIGSVISELGFKGLWLGTGTRAVFTAILSAGMFFIYDSAKMLMGLPASGGRK